MGIDHALNPPRARLDRRALFMASPLVVACRLAAPNDYRFELVQAQPAGAGKTIVTVRLVHVPDNKPVAGAVLFESKTDMAPGGMPPRRSHGLCRLPPPSCRGRGFAA
jgi:hypothetical protein